MARKESACTLPILRISLPFPSLWEFFRRTEPSASQNISLGFRVEGLSLYFTASEVIPKRVSLHVPSEITRHPGLVFVDMSTKALVFWPGMMSEKSLKHTGSLGVLWEENLAFPRIGSSLRLADSHLKPQKRSLRVLQVSVSEHGGSDA